MTIRIRDPLFSGADEIDEAPYSRNYDGISAARTDEENDCAAAHHHRLLDAATIRRLERLGSTVEETNSKVSVVTDANIDGRMPATAVVVRKPKSKAATQIRHITTALLAKADNNASALFSVVALRNPAISEYIAVNVAASLAMAKRPTLLIDANLRQNGIAGLFNLQAENSFGQAIRRGDPDHATPSPTTLEGLHILAAGSKRQNCEEYFSVDVVRQTLDRLKGRYEHVVVNAPPALTCHYSRIILAATRQSLVAVQRDCDRVKSLHAICGILRESDAQILGSILTR